MSIKWNSQVVMLCCFLWGLNLGAVAGLCEKRAFSNSYSDFRNPDSFFKAMTENLHLREGQDSLMAFYLKNKTPYPIDTNYIGLEDVLEVLNRYPELSKIQMREQILEFSIIKRESPDSLKSFIASFRKSAGKIRNSLFHIEENLGFWMNMLGFKERNKPYFGPAEQRAVQQKQTEDFLNHLATIGLPSHIRLFIKNKNHSYRERTKVLYQALFTLALHTKRGTLASPARQKVLNNIHQAMVNLVHTAGFGNPVWTAGLKNSDPDTSFEALRSILNARDLIAFDLGFEGHFKELKEKLGSKIPDETKILNQIQEDINNPLHSVTEQESIRSQVLSRLQEAMNPQPHQVKGKETLRLRALSLQESPFRSCLAGDCATASYFERALDPNFLYFTLTDSQFRSSGHVTVVLGVAEHENGQKVKTGFVDKIQNIPTHRLSAILEGIRLSLKEQAYVLALPKDMGDTNGLSNEILISDYVESKILPGLKHGLNNFKPHTHGFSFSDMQDLSRAKDNLPLLMFEGVSLKDVAITTGEIYPPQTASYTFNIDSLLVPIHNLISSKKEEHHLRFLSHLLMMWQADGFDLPKKQVEQYVDFILTNPGFSFKVRKKAFYILAELEMLKKDNWLFDPMSMLIKKSKLFSSQEKQVIIGEMSNWKSTNDYRAFFIQTATTQAINNWRNRHFSGFRKEERQKEQRQSYYSLPEILDSPWGKVLDTSKLLKEIDFMGIRPEDKSLLVPLLEKAYKTYGLE